jgi:hypothetical protein
MRIQGYLSESEYDKVITIIKNIQASKLIKGENCTIGRAIVILADYYGNGESLIKEDGDVLPEYYKMSRMRELRHWAFKADEGFTGPQQWLEKDIPSIMKTEKDKDDINALDKIDNRNDRLVYITEYINKLYKRVEVFLNE